jgi:CO/xanthine dehydrogenase FAD-binding subunit
MHEFEYVAPEKLADAAALMAKHAGSAQMMAGGTDLLIFMRVGRTSPQVVIDAKKIPELTQLELSGNKLTIGASVSCRTIWENAEIAEKFPALIDATSLVGGIQIQGRASIGGNLCNAAPSADTVPAIIAYGATAHIINGSGSREVPVEEICTGPGQTSLADDEILVNLTIPLPPQGASAKFLRFIPRNEMDIAVANVGSYVELDLAANTFKSARIAIGAVAPKPLFVEAAGASLAGKAIGDEAIAEAARIARDAATPINDMRGTIEHRKQLVEVLTKRTLNAAIARAKGEKE